MSNDTSNASKFTWQEHKTHIDPDWAKPRAYTLLNLSWNSFSRNTQKKSFGQLGMFMWQLSTKRSRAQLCAVTGVNNVFNYIFRNNSCYQLTLHTFTDYKAISFCCFKKSWKSDFASRLEVFMQSLCDLENEESHELRTARYVEATIAGESLLEHEKRGTNRTLPMDRLYIQDNYQDGNAISLRARIVTAFPQHWGIARMEHPMKLAGNNATEHIWDGLHVKTSMVLAQGSVKP